LHNAIPQMVKRLFLTAADRCSAMRYSRYSHLGRPLQHYVLKHSLLYAADCCSIWKKCWVAPERREAHRSSFS